MMTTRPPDNQIDQLTETPNSLNDHKDEQVLEQLADLEQIRKMVEYLWGKRRPAPPGAHITIVALTAFRTVKVATDLKEKQRIVFSVATDSLDKIAKVIQAMDKHGDRDVYAPWAYTEAKGRSKANIIGTYDVHADFDLKNTTHTEEKVLAHLRSLPWIKLILKTRNGFHVAGALAEFCPDLDWIEDIHRGLIEDEEEWGIDDAAVDLTHVLRFPTHHRKEEVDFICQLLYVDFETTTPIESFRRVSKPKSRHEWQDFTAEIPQEGDVEFLKMLRRMKHGKLASRIETQQGAENVAGRKCFDANNQLNRSANDFEIACELLFMEQSPGVVFWVLTHASFFSGARFRQFKNVKYVQRTINKALELLMPSEEEELANGFFKGNAFQPQPFIDYLKEHFKILRVVDDFALYTQGVYSVPLSPKNSQLKKRMSTTLSKRSAAVHINAAHDLLLHQEDIPEWPDIDDPYYVNIQNGLIDLRRRILVPHDPEIVSTYQFPIYWDPTAKFDLRPAKDYIYSMYGEEDGEFFFEYGGYALRYGSPCKDILFVQGDSDSGKNSLTEVLMTQYGPGVQAFSLAKLLNDKWVVGHLARAVINIADEASSSRIAINDFVQLKSLFSGAMTKVEGEKKYVDYSKYILVVKSITFANDFPITNAASVDKAAIRRIHFLQTQQTFARNAANNRIVTEMKTTHKNALTALFVEGLFRYLGNGEQFTITKTMEERKKQYIKDNNPIEMYVEKELIIGEELLRYPEEERYTTKSDLLQHYACWTIDLMRAAKMNDHVFKTTLENSYKDQGVHLGPKYFDRGNGRRTQSEVWLGVKLRRSYTDIKRESKGDDPIGTYDIKYGAQ